jgi:hypothetical protein|nr:hypothetical protein [Kofleriaceae bacterium]
MKLTYLSTAMALAFAIGCGGDDGPGSDEAAGSLSTADQMAECNKLANEFPQKQVDCGLGSDNPTVGVNAADCSGSDFATFPSTCTVTVGQFEACDGDIYNEGSAFCSGNVPSSCAPLLSAGSACETN